MTTAINSFAPPLFTTPCRSLAAALLALAAPLYAQGSALDFQAQALDQGRFDGKSLQGQVVLIDFWAVWCSPCVKAFPALSELHSRYRHQGFRVLGVALYSGSPRDVAEFVKEHPVSYRVVVGGEDLAERFGVIGFPTYFLIGRDGRILRKFVGEDNDFEPAIRKAIKKGEQP